MTTVRHFQRHRRLYVAGGIICTLATALWLGARPVDVLDAAPHTISVPAEHHPYDADWPDVYMIMMNKCSACHRTATEDRVDLTTYDAIIDAEADGERIVVPGDPDKSLLWEYVVWNVEAKKDSPHPRSPMMPEEHSEWLSKGQLDIIHRWISNGALQYKLPGHCSTRPLMEFDFPSAKICKQCHPKQYDEWSRSMHAYAQHSPVFEAFNLTLIERTGGTVGTFCSRCHTPIGTALGENGSRRNINRSRISMEGVTCIVCHRAVGNYYKANARHAIEPGLIHEGCMYGPFEDSASAESDSHHSAEKPYLKQSAFCGGCHDVTNPAGVRLEEAFSEWKNSPAAKRGQTCQSCHMGPVQGKACPDHMRPLGRAAEAPFLDPKKLPLRRLSDHTFAGPDHSMLPDTEFPHKLDWMYETDYRQTDKLTPYQKKSLHDLRVSNRRSLAIARQKRMEVLSHAARLHVYAPREATTRDVMKVRVDVESILAGHSFPTGFTAERQLWVEITVVDPNGKPIFKSGDFDKNGDLKDSHSHGVEEGKLAYDRYLLNFQNKFTALTAVGTDREVVLSVNRHLQPVNVLRPATGISASFGRPASFRIAKASLPPLETIGRTYPVWIGDQEGPYQVIVRLNFRNLPPTLLDKIGVPHLKRQLEVVVIGEKVACVHVRAH